MEDNTSKQEPKVRWTKLLKPTFMTKVNKTKTRWTRILKEQMKGKYLLKQLDNIPTS